MSSKGNSNKGVKTFAVFQLVVSAFFIISFISALSQFSTVSEQIVGVSTDALKVSIIISLVFLSACAVAAVGIYNLKEWARVTQTVLGVIAALYFALSPLFFDAFPNVLILVYAIVALWFFNKQDTKKVFG